MPRAGASQLGQCTSISQRSAAAAAASFRRRCRGRVEDRCSKPVQRLGEFFEPILDHPHLDAFRLVPPILLAGVDRGQVEPSRSTASRGSRRLRFTPPEQVGTLSSGLLPERVAELPVGQAQHAGLSTGSAA